MKRRSAFTLVELLVVIAIIAMLLAIMVPTLSYSRQLAYRLGCLNNLKQLGVAVEAYVQSYKFYPVCVSDVSEKWSDFLADKTKPAGELLGVPVSLWPFHQTAGLYNCPISVRAGCDISYCYNYLAGKKYAVDEPVIEPSYIPPTPPEEQKADIRLLAPENVKTAATFVLLYDLPTKPQQVVNSLYKDIDPDDYESSYRDPNKEGYLADANAGPHSEGYDILFADGHIKWHKRWSGSSMNRSPR
ncbi:MAG: prepilin-type N-terminal cleavage/methylation domain-containing protein [Phycisphaerae bacterium]|nr:prepilin-type N-terminal cleavage/methylation domain-containing protein [Phycisphaerae bacterium]